MPRFICDSMTEGLARQLRLCGIDARSAPGAIGCPRYRAYMELSSAASSEQRVVLTADTVFLRARSAPQCSAHAAGSHEASHLDAYCLGDMYLYLFNHPVWLIY